MYCNVSTLGHEYEKDGMLTAIREGTFMHHFHACGSGIKGYTTRVLQWWLGVYC